MIGVGLGESAARTLVLVAAAISAAGVIVKYVVRWTRNLIHFFQRLDKALNNVETQLYPNGGSSLRDAVNRIQFAIGVQNIPSKGKTVDQALAASGTGDIGAPDRQPPSTLLARIADLETRSLAAGRTEDIVAAVHEAVTPTGPRE